MNEKQRILGVTIFSRTHVTHTKRINDQNCTRNLRNREDHRVTVKTGNYSPVQILRVHEATAAAKPPRNHSR